MDSHHLRTRLQLPMRNSRHAGGRLPAPAPAPGPLLPLVNQSISQWLRCRGNTMQGQHELRMCNPARKSSQQGPSS
jgi:hypothetical protein